MEHLLFELTTGIFCVLVRHLYLRTMLDKRKDVSAILYWLCLILSHILLIPISDFFFGSYTDIKVVVLNALTFIALFLITFFYQSTLRHRLLTAFIYVFLADVCELLPAQMLFLISRYFLPLTMEQIELLVQAQQDLWFFLILAFIRIFYRERGKQSSLKYRLSLVITPLFSIIIIEYNYSAIFPSEASMIFSIACTAMLFAINIINFVLLDNFSTINELEKKNASMEQQITYQANKYEQISSAYRNTRRILHDMKKHFFFLETCIKNHETESSIPYMKHAMEELEVTYNRINTGNLVIDSFLSSNLELATSEGIKFTTNLNVAATRIPVEDYDLSIILGNLLDNALAECRNIKPPALRFICVELFTTETQFQIHVVNSSIPPDEKHQNTDLAYTLYHGYGIENIRILTRKYFGSYDFRQEPDAFDSAIMIPIITDRLPRR